MSQSRKQSAVEDFATIKRYYESCQTLEQIRTTGRIHERWIKFRGPIPEQTFNDLMAELHRAEKRVVAKGKG